MDKLTESAPSIIEQAAKSTLGIFALMILALAVLGFFFFRRSSEWVRAAMYGLMLIGVASFGWATVRSTRDSSPGNGPPAINEDQTSVAPAAGNVSTDRYHPTPLTSRGVRGVVDCDTKRVRYYTDFQAGPGEFKATFDFTARGLAQMAGVTFFDDDWRKLESLYVGGNSDDNIVKVRRVELIRQKHVIAEVDLDCTFGGKPGYFILRVDGAVQFP